MSNALVPALSDTGRDQLQLIAAPQGGVLLEAGEKARYVYFPVGCIVSLLHAMENGSSAQVAVVGHEGMVGVELFLSNDSSPYRAVVHCGGAAYRLRADLFRSELDRNENLQPLMLRYTHSLITHMAQTAACNRHHTVDQQLCRWLLLSLDRSSSSRIVMTQELIANMLGVRREGVTEAACKLQKLGVIAYSRGRIDILDRSRLEALSCECYEVVRLASDRMLAPARAPLTTGFAARRPLPAQVPLRMSA